MNLADLLLTMSANGYTVSFMPYSTSFNEIRIRVSKPIPLTGELLRSEYLVALDFIFPSMNRNDYLCGIINQLSHNVQDGMAKKIAEENADERG